MSSEEPEEGAKEENVEMLATAFIIIIQRINFFYVIYNFHTGILKFMYNNGSLLRLAQSHKGGGERRECGNA